MLPVGADRALTDSIGHHGLEDLLILQGVAQAYGRLRRLRIILGSRRTAAAASAWLGQVLSGHGHSGASS